MCGYDLTGNTTGVCSECGAERAVIVGWQKGATWSFQHGERRWITITLLGIVLTVLTSLGAKTVLTARAHRQRDQATGRVRYDMLYELGDRLEDGMDHAQVRAVMGLPDNTDLGYVWIWVCDEKQTIPNGSPSWHDLWRVPDESVTPNVYLLFDREGYLCWGLDEIQEFDEDPIELYSSFTDLTYEEAAALLGPPPE
jgi:hypothetical protein